MTRAGVESRRALCVITPEYFDGNRMVAFESLMARRLDPSGSESRLIPLLLRNTKLPEWMRGLIPVDWTSESSRPREWRKLLLALGASNAEAPPPGSSPESVQPIDSRRRTFLPSSSWEQVNPAVTRRVLTQAITMFIIAIAARIAVGYPNVLSSLGLSMSKPEVLSALNHSAWCGLGSLLAAILLWTQFMDTQFVLSLARVLLFVALLGLLCAVVTCMPGISPWIHGLIFTLFIAAGSIYYFIFGMAKYYWQRREYGDVASETLIFLLFLYIMRRPLLMVLGG